MRYDSADTFSVMLFNAIAIVGLTGATVSAVLAVSFPQLKSFLEYGKSRNNQRTSTANSHLLSVLGKITVPREWFSHFYIVLVTLTLFKCGYNQKCALRDVLLLIHGLRRTFEQLWLFPASPGSVMHLSHYLMGIFFYPVQALCYIEESPEYTALAVLLFLAASVFQHLCHRTLAQTRKYEFPQFPLTSWSPKLTTACPHYGAEIALYLSLLLLSKLWAATMTEWLANGLGTAFLTVVWVVTCLGISGSQSREYYRRQSRAENRHNYRAVKWVMFPYIY